MENTSKFPAAPNRRAVLAFITLADLPVPIEVNFHDETSLFVKVETAAEVDGWAALLGLGSPNLTTGDPGRRDIYSISTLQLNGWYVNITAYISAGTRSGLDVETGTQLQQLVDDATGGVK